MFFSTTLVILITLLNILVYKLRQHQEANSGNKLLPPTSDHLCRRFSLAEIKLATRDFDEALVIGRGGFGKVYKGEIKDGASNSISIAAIKRLSFRSEQGAPEFWTEIEMLSRFRHSHLVTLIGYCDDYQEMIIVYEYLSGGTLADHLHRLSESKPNHNPLSWVQRLKVCIGAARGLDYLHTGTSVQHRVIHRDVKSTNILLDENFVAKISDFGLSKIGPANQVYTHANTTHVSTKVRGTFGYLDPEYYLTSRLTSKSDVYAFGVVLFEVLCGRPAVDLTVDEEQYGLAGWVKHCIKDGKLDQIIDPRVREQILSNCLTTFVHIAKKCLHKHPKKRPTMSEVVVCLESALALQERKVSSAEPQHPWQIGGGKRLGDASSDQSRVKSEKTMAFTQKVRQFLFGTADVISVQNEVKPSRNRKSKHISIANNAVPKKDEGGVLEESPKEQIVAPKAFAFSDLKSATLNFGSDMLLGEGSCGKVFKGWIDRKTCAPSEVGVGMAIVVKDITPHSLKGIEEMQLKLKFVGGLNHPNLVKLVGYCHEDKKFLVVYEYMEGGSLESHLFGCPGPLPWDVRLKIAIGSARGLAFLHAAEEQVIYRGFTASDILLDAEYNAKLSNFGLATLGPVKGYPYGTTFVVGTSGYAAPEYLNTGRLDAKSDVYGFGVVLLEMLTGQHVIDVNRPKEMRDLVRWAWPFLTLKHKVKSIMDPRMVVYYPLDGAFHSVVPMVILKCLDNNPKNRPFMKEVVEMLEQCDY